MPLYIFTLHKGHVQLNSEEWELEHEENYTTIILRHISPSGQLLRSYMSPFSSVAHEGKNQSPETSASSDGWCISVSKDAI